MPTATKRATIDSAAICVSLEALAAPVVTRTVEAEALVEGELAPAAYRIRYGAVVSCAPPVTMAATASIATADAPLDTPMLAEPDAFAVRAPVA